VTILSPKIVRFQLRDTDLGEGVADLKGYLWTLGQGEGLKNSKSSHA
jgi:hypothetical protein